MPTGIRFPSELPLPLRDGYAIGFEETRSSLRPESGHGRNRRTVRTQPRTERLVWSFSQEQFHLFDLWWQFTIESGAREFDLLLTDAILGTTWFTARWLGNYQAEMTSDAYRWRVSGTVRMLGEPFAERPSGTDELRGVSTVGISASGNLLVERLMYASAVFDLTARARLSGSGGFLSATLDFTATSRIPLGPLRGDCTVGITAAADASQFGIGAPQVARVWTGMQFWRYGRSPDINANEEAVRRSAMGLTNGIY